MMIGVRVVHHFAATNPATNCARRLANAPTAVNQNANDIALPGSVTVRVIGSSVAAN